MKIVQFALLSVCLVSVANAADFNGVWQGIADVGGSPLHVRLVVSGAPDATKAVVDMLEAALPDFEIPKVAIHADVLDFSVPPGWGLAMFRDIGLTPDEQHFEYHGTLGTDSRIHGYLTFPNATVPLDLAPPPDDALVRYEDVRFANGELSLAGTLISPRYATSRLPAVVFTHGSGSRTRRAHWVEAEELAGRGVAALVYDKRGAGASRGGNWQVATLEELSTDAEAAVEFLRTRGEIDPGKIGVYGLSQGSWIGSKLAGRSRHIAFLVSVSGSGIPLWQQELYRARSFMQLYNYPAADIEAAQDFIRRRFVVGRTGTGWEALDTEMKALREKDVKWFNEFGDGPGSLVSARFWWLAFWSYDPAGDLRRARIPVLGLFGAHDLSVPPVEAADAMRAALPPNKNTRFVTLSSADHSMLSTVSVNGRAVCKLLSPEYVRTLADWVVAVTAARQPSKHVIPKK